MQFLTKLIEPARQFTTERLIGAWVVRARSLNQLNVKSSVVRTYIVNIGMRQTRVIDTPAVIARSHCHVATRVARVAV